MFYFYVSIHSFDCVTHKVSQLNQSHYDLFQRIHSYQNLSKPFYPYTNPTKPFHTYQNLEPIQTYSNLFKHIQTLPKLITEIYQILSKTFSNQLKLLQPHSNQLYPIQTFSIIFLTYLTVCQPIQTFPKFSNPFHEPFVNITKPIQGHLILSNNN